MTFDVVVGNPPFQANNESKGNKLWPKFIAKANTLLSDGGYLAFVVPSSWTTGGNNTPDRIGVLRDILTKNFTKAVNLSDSLGKHFPNIGISFSWFVMQKASASLRPTKVITDTDIIEVDFSTVAFLPTKVSALTLSIYTKIFSLRAFDVVSYDRQKDTKKSDLPTPMNNIKHWVLGTGNDAQYCYLPYDKTPEFSKKRKVLFPLRKFSNVSMIHVDDIGIPVCQQGFYVDIGDADINCVTSVWESALFRFLTYGAHPSGFLKISIIQKLPEVPYDRIWTDQELYAHFNLTQEEIDYIEANVK